MESDTQRRALTALYEQCGGEAWRQCEGWLTGADVCAWRGVTCAGERVTRLELPRNRLQGILPAELGLLAYLTRLDLAGNDLSGRIPDEIGNLRALTHLDLSENDLRGTLPARLRLLRHLRVLDLHGNALTGPLPAALGDLAALEALDLAGNRLAGPAPPAWGRLVRLTSLALDHNAELAGPLPRSLTALTALEALSFDHTGLLEPPEPEVQAWLDRIPRLSRSGVLYAEVVAPGSRLFASLAALGAGLGTLGAGLGAAIVLLPLLGPLAGVAAALTGTAGAGLVGKRVYEITVQPRPPAPALAPPADDPDTALRTALAQELRETVRAARTDALARNAPALAQELDAIELLLLDLLGRIGHLSSGEPDVYTVRQTVRDYLPSALAPYRAMPARYAAEQPIAAGQTAEAHVLAQLRLLHGALDGIAARLPEAEAQRLLVHGRFLAGKFGNEDGA